jgi:hypothetical protein
MAAMLIQDLPLQLGWLWLVLALVIAGGAILNTAALVGLGIGLAAALALSGSI